MTRWATGATELERMLARRELDAVTGAGANGEQWLTRARRTVATAARTAEFDPDNAYSLAAATRLLPNLGFFTP